MSTEFAICIASTVTQLLNSWVVLQPGDADSATEQVRCVQAISWSQTGRIARSTHISAS